MTVLTYRQLAVRGWVTTRSVAAAGFWLIVMTRAQLAFGWTTPVAYDLTVGVLGVGVALVAVGSAGVCGWARCSDALARRRSRRAIVVPIARHRKGRLS